MVIKDRVIEIAEKLGWSVTIDNTDEFDTWTFEWYSPAGQDFSFDIDVINNNKAKLIRDILTYWEDFDISYETYIWLDSSGHGKNNAPYDMRDVYNDMEACVDKVYELWEKLCDEYIDDWDEEDENE